jgi:hypothetical protein
MGFTGAACRKPLEGMSHKGFLEPPVGCRELPLGRSIPAFSNTDYDTPDRIQNYIEHVRDIITQSRTYRHYVVVYVSLILYKNHTNSFISVVFLVGSRENRSHRFPRYDAPAVHRPA